MGCHQAANVTTGAPLLLIFTLFDLIRAMYVTCVLIISKSMHGTLTLMFDSARDAKSYKRSNFTRPCADLNI